MVKHQNLRIYLICLGLFLVPQLISKMTSTVRMLAEIIFTTDGNTVSFVIENVFESALITGFIYFLVLKNQRVIDFISKHNNFECTNLASDQNLDFNMFVKLIGIIYLPLSFLLSVKQIIKFDFYSFPYYFSVVANSFFIVFAYFLVFKTKYVTKYIITK